MTTPGRPFGTSNALAAGMTTQPLHHGPVWADRSTGSVAKAEPYVVLLGRVCYSLIFIEATPGHFSSNTIRYAAQHGVPFPQVVVPAAGILALIGGVSVLTGFRARIGAWLLVLFLVPVTLMMHNFWAVAAPAAAQMQKAMFLKNVGLLGGALLIAYFGSGPASVDRVIRDHRQRLQSVTSPEASRHA